MAWFVGYNIYTSSCLLTNLLWWNYNIQFDRLLILWIKTEQNTNWETMIANLFQMKIKVLEERRNRVLTKTEGMKKSGMRKANSLDKYWALDLFSRGQRSFLSISTILHNFYYFSRSFFHILQLIYWFSFLSSQFFYFLLFKPT